MNAVHSSVISKFGNIADYMDELLSIACTYPGIERIESLSEAEMLKVRKQSYDYLRLIRYQLEKALQENLQLMHIQEASRHTTNSRLVWDGEKWTYRPINDYALEYRKAIYHTLKLARQIANLDNPRIRVG